MAKRNVHRGLWLLLVVLWSATIVAGQERFAVQAGLVREYHIDRQPDITEYVWEVFSNPGLSVPASSDQAQLIAAGIGRENTVQVYWKSEGTFYLMVTVTDVTGCSNKMAWIFDVGPGVPVNQNPVANADHVSMRFDQGPLMVDVQANDFDPEGGMLITSIVVPPSSGANVEVVNGDSIRYQPAPGFIGTDFFVYQVCDDGTPSMCAADTVFVHVLDHIVANTDTAEVFAGAQVNIPLLNNDLFSVPVVVSILRNPRHGDYIMLADGTLSYTAYDDYAGNDTLVYRIENAGGSDTAFVIITSLPRVEMMASTFCNGDEAWIMWDARPYGFSTGTINLRLYDLNGTLVQFIENAPLKGSVPWPGFDQKSAPKPPYQLSTISIYIEVADLPELNEMTVQLNYPDCSANTVVAMADTVTVFGVPTIVAVLANDYDPDEGDVDPSTLRLYNDTLHKGPYHGTVSILSDGTLTYTPKPFFNGIDSFIYIVCDNMTPPACDTAMVTVTVISNHPLVVNDDRFTLDAGRTNVLEVLANDYDPEGKIDLNTLQLVHQPIHGDVVVNADGTLSYTPRGAFVGNDSLSYHVCDADLPQTCGTAWVYISVIDRNLGIVALPDSAVSIDGKQVVIRILDNDYDPDTISTIDPATVTLVQIPVYGTATVNPDGTLTYTPENEYTGYDTLVYRVCDTAPLSACDTALVIIRMVRELPPVANNDSVRLYHGVETKLDLFDNDYDYYGGLVFTSIEITRAPSGGSVSIDTLTGVIVYKPDVCTFGVDSFEYVVYNEKGTSSNPAVVYIAVDIHPTLDSDGDGIADNLEDVVGTGNLCDSDTDGNKVPNFLDPDDDGDGIPTVLQHGDLNKNGVPDYLENWNSKAVDDETLTGLEIPVSIPVLRNDSTTMVPATLHIINYSKHGFTNIDWSTNTIVYNPDLGFTGLDSILYMVCDYYNICDSATVYITVEDIIVAPELFTPNGDGFNDVFIIRGLDRYPQNHFVVYNRWGNKVYEKANYANDWDGTANVRGALGNRQLPTGVYFFILKYGSNKEIQRGFFLER